MGMMAIFAFDRPGVARVVRHCPVGVGPHPDGFRPGIRGRTGAVVAGKAEVVERSVLTVYSGIGAAEKGRVRGVRMAVVARYVLVVRSIIDCIGFAGKDN
jgi:hypothetical protein